MCVTRPRRFGKTMALSMCGVKGCYYLIYKNGGTAYYELNPSLGGAGYFITQARTSGRDNTATNICFNNILYFKIS